MRFVMANNKVDYMEVHLTDNISAQAEPLEPEELVDEWKQKIKTMAVSIKD